MTPQAQIVRVERVLREIKHALGAMPSSPRSRELRARLGTFERGLLNLAGRTPSEVQATALLDAVLELYSRVFPAERRPSRAGPLSQPAMFAALTTPSQVPVPRSQHPTTPPASRAASVPGSVPTRSPSPPRVGASLPPLPSLTPVAPAISLPPISITPVPASVAPKSSPPKSTPPKSTPPRL
ncbi:MAG: hypothetical protein IPG50_06470 [Myxococcales bacterium]|nr:hypothetical protein [Myxococcales bacterium]